MEENKNEQQEQSEQLSQKADEVIELKKQLEEKEDRLKRLMAEFDNFKKRSIKERDMLYNNLISDIIKNLLPVLDNLEKAAMAETKDEGYKQGIELLLKQFKEVLTANGVQEIETVGTTFDPEVHEAVSLVTDESLGEKEIKEEFRKGSKIGNKVIRHAMVVVANWNEKLRLSSLDVAKKSLTYLFVRFRFF